MSESKPRGPSRPTHVSPHAEACLQALAASGLGDRISLGGAFGLLHYLDYRPTHDVDAWWVSSATEKDRRRVVEAIETVLVYDGVPGCPSKLMVRFTQIPNRLQN